MCSVEEEEEDGEVWGLTRIEWSGGGEEEEDSFLFKEAEEEGPQEE